MRGGVVERGIASGAETAANVPGADRSDVKKAVGTAIFHNFNDTELSNLWVQLT